MYIRFKRIKKESGNTYEYCYLVGSKWRKRKKQAKQVHSKFLGRVYNFEENENKRDIKYIIENNSSTNIIKEILVNELICRGFEKNKEMYEKDGIIIDFEKKSVKFANRDSVIRVGDKGISEYTLSRVLRFDRITSMDEGKEFIKSLKECGIKISGEELFLLIDKMNRENSGIH